MDGSFTESPLDSALRLADTHGWYVIPVKVTPLPNGKSNKSPLIKWGDGASNDPDVIEAMVTSKKGVPAWECATHVGVNCRRSGVWVIDEDAEGAANSLNLPETLIISTRRGRHFIYTAADFDQRNTQSEPVPGVDIRANNGMFVVYGGVLHDAEIAMWPFEYVIGAKSTTNFKLLKCLLTELGATPPCFQVCFCQLSNWGLACCEFKGVFRKINGLVFFNA